MHNGMIVLYTNQKPAKERFMVTIVTHSLNAIFELHGCFCEASCGCGREPRPAKFEEAHSTHRGRLALFQTSKAQLQRASTQLQFYSGKNGDEFHHNI
jgi:hypothetical protein